MDEYRTIRLKNAVISAIEHYINEHPEHGYKSIADFVTDAVREKLLELKVFDERTHKQAEVEA